MALAETTLRIVHKYNVVPRLVRFLPIISLVFTLAGVTWLAVLPVDGQYRHTYISENALMPSQVTSYFRETEWNIVRGYRNQLNIYEGADAVARNHVVAEWLVDNGIKTSYYNENNHTTLYGIIHASRGEDTEAMVLVVPWTTSDGDYNVGGAAVGLALTRYFNRMSIWSKNIIIVFVQDTHLGLRNWVDAYHSRLDTTAGSIEAAIILEYAGNSDYFDYYEMWYEGLNGQLPNLDLLNTAYQVSYQENIHVSIQNTPGELLTRDTYWSRLTTLLKGIVSLCIAGIKRPINGSESFSGWSIQAFTIKVRGTSGPNDITQIGRVIDLTFRSVNNLLEKFHQSFFFYLLLSPKYFVSIGTYLPAAVLVAISYALSALSCLLRTNIAIPQFVLGIGNVLLIFTLIEISSYIIADWFPRWVAGPDPLHAVRSIIGFFVVVNLLISALAFYKPPTPLRIASHQAYSLIAFSLLVISTIIIMLLILNFSLAFMIGLVLFPLTFVQQILHWIETETDPRRLFNAKLLLSACLFVSNPIVILLVTGRFYLGDLQQLILGLLKSYDDLQCWTWYIIMLGWFPSWLCIGISCLLGDFTTVAKDIKTR